MVGMLAPEFEEQVTGEAEVREIFRVPKLGAIAGCYVRSGVITRGSKVRFLRDGTIIWKGDITSLKRFKDDAREVREGFECGIGLSDFQDLKPGDLIETFEDARSRGREPSRGWSDGGRSRLLLRPGLSVGVDHLAMGGRRQRAARLRRSTGGSSRCGSSTRRTPRSGTRPSTAPATTWASRGCVSLMRSAWTTRQQWDAGTPRSARHCTFTHNERWPEPTRSSWYGGLLSANGFDESYIDAADDESHDDHIRADTELALSRTGRDVGTPILTFHPGADNEASFFGPVISKAPTGTEALELWDAVETLAAMPGMAELKRSTRAAPDFT